MKGMVIIMYQDKIVDIIADMGIMVVRNNEDDINLQEYIIDSLQFISFILELERTFDIEFPDEMLLYESIQSLNGLASMVELLVSSS